MSRSDLLRIYLRDHHATATAGTELAKRCVKSNVGTPFETLTEEVRAETLDDLRTMEDLMSRIGVTPARGKDGALWLAEKAGRLKLNGALTSYSPLSRVIEFEGLALLTIANKSVWTTLRDIQDDSWDESELERLEARADDRIRRLSEAQREATRIAFSTSRSG